MNQFFHYNILFVLLLLGVSISSCQQETFVEYGQGNLCITLAGGSVTLDTKAETERPVHYNAELSELLQEHFRLKIVNSSNERVAYEGSFQATIPVNEGSYQVKATYGTNEILAWSAPYFVGETNEPVVVEKKSDSPVIIICTQQNAMASINFGENDIHKAAFDEMFEAGYGVEVQVEDYKILIEAGMSGRRIYYRAGSNPTFTFKGRIKNGPEVEWNLKTQTTGTTQETINQPGSYAAATHLVLTLALQPVSGAGLIPTITLAEVKKETINNSIPLEWLPKPKIAAGGDFQGNVLSFMETESKSHPFTFDLASKFQDLKLTFEFEDPQFSMYNKTYLLSEALQNETDRAALSDIFGVELTTLEALGDLRDFDLGSLVSRLQTNYGTTSRNKITIDVKANDRWSSEDQVVNREFVLECKAPTLTVSVQDYNVWAKSFTIDECQIPAVCDVNKIKQSLVYQYSIDGTSWHDCNNGRSHTFKAADGSDQNASESFPAVKKYYVRSLYRGSMASNKPNLTLENSQQVPNSDMESWTTEKYITFTESDSWGTKKTSYRFYPYASTTDIWWATNNERSQDGTIVLGLGNMTCFAPCVSYATDVKHGGERSALIYTSGHGGGYSSTGEIIYTEGSMAGNLFIGSYTNYSSSGTLIDNREINETITTGHAFGNRPTHFSFWYKYMPKGSDQFKIHVELRNESTVIATGTYIPEAYSIADADFKNYKIELSYSDMTKKATSVYIQFLSTIKTSFSTSDFNQNMTFTFPLMGGWQVHIGSRLYVDDLELIYGK